MDALFTAQFQWLWTFVLALALFLPVRNLIWTLQLRRAARIKGEAVDEAEQVRLKKRASVSSGLLCFVFSLVYVNNLFQG